MALSNPAQHVRRVDSFLLRARHLLLFTTATLVFQTIAVSRPLHAEEPLPTPAVGQFEDQADAEIQLPTPIDAYGATITGEFEYGRFRGMAIQHDGEVLLATSPELLDRSVTLPARDVTAIAAWPGRGADGLDAILYCDASGMYETHREADPAGFSDPVQVGDHRFWLNARAVHVADLNGDGELDAYGLHYSGIAVVLTYSIGLSNETNVVELIAAYATTATEIVAFRANTSDVASTLAMQTDVGLVISDLGLTAPSTTVYPGGGTGFVRTLDRLGDDSQSIVWLNEDGGDTLLYTYQGGSLASAVDLGAITVVGMDTGDCDDDGFVDVLYSTNSAYDLNLLSSDAGTFHPASVRSFDLDPGATAATSQMSPRFVDLDNDGDLDIAAPCDSLASLRLFHSGRIDATMQQPQFDPTTGFHYAANYDESEIQLQITLTPAQSVPAAATHVVVSLYNRSGVANSTDPLPFDRVIVAKDDPLVFDFAIPSSNPGSLQGALFFTAQYVEDGVPQYEQGFSPVIRGIVTNGLMLDFLTIDYIVHSVVPFYMQVISTDILQDPDGTNDSIIDVKPVPDVDDDDDDDLES